MLSELDKRRTLLDTPEGLEELQRELLGALDTIGRHVRVERANDTLHGVATTVNDDGLLLLETDEGLVEVVFGDIVHLRATEPSGFAFSSLAPPARSVRTCSTFSREGRLWAVTRVSSRMDCPLVPTSSP